MLHSRCSAPDHCCLKLSDEDITGLGASTGQVYANPFFPGEKSEDGGFLPGDLALMYDPPMNDDLDYTSDEQEADVPVERRGNMGPQLRSPVLLQPAGPAAQKSTPRSDGVALALPSSPQQLPKSSTPFGPCRDRLQEDVPVKASQSRSLPQMKALPTQPAMPGRAGASQPRTFSRSVADAKSCSSEVGAASIAAIMQCVAQADEIPSQQKPNSEKWSERLNDYTPKQLGD